MLVRIDDSNTIWLLQETERRGISSRFYEQSQVIELRLADHVELLSLNEGFQQHRLYADIFGDKSRAKMFLKERGVPVVDGRVFSVQEHNALREYAASELGTPCVLKAIDKSCGDFVFPQIRSLAELDEIFAKQVVPGGLTRVMAEAQFPTADDYRFFVCDGRPVEVIKREPPYVVGDGVHSIRQLVDAENHRRLVPHRISVSNRIWLEDIDGNRALSHQGLTLRTIPAQGQRVVLRYTSNAQYGGVTTTFTQETHASYKDLARRVLDMFPGRRFLWVDMLIRDPRTPADPRNHVVVELSYAACMAGFLRPTYGAAVDIAPAIIDQVFPETRTQRAMFSATASYSTTQLVNRPPRSP